MEIRYIVYIIMFIAIWIQNIIKRISEYDYPGADTTWLWWCEPLDSLAHLIWAMVWALIKPIVCIGVVYLILR